MTLTGHHDAVTCLNLTFDSRKVISGSLDHNLKFWDLLNGKVSTGQHSANFFSKLGLPHARKWSGKKNFKVREKAGNYNAADLIPLKARKEQFRSL